MRTVTLLALAALVLAVPTPEGGNPTTPQASPQQGGMMKTIHDDAVWAGGKLHDDAVWAGGRLHDDAVWADQKLHEGVDMLRAYYASHMPWIQEKFHEGVQFAKDETNKFIAWGKTTAGKDIAWIKQKGGEWQIVAEADVKATLAKGRELANKAGQSFDAHMPWLSAKIKAGVHFAHDETDKAYAWAQTKAGPYVAWIRVKGAQWEKVAEADLQAVVAKGKALATQIKNTVEGDLPWLREKFQEEVKVITDDANKFIAWGKTTAGKDLAWIKEKEGQWKKVAEADIKATIAKAKEVAQKTEAGAQTWFQWARTGVQNWWNGPQQAPTSPPKTQ